MLEKSLDIFVKEVLDKKLNKILIYSKNITKKGGNFMLFRTDMADERRDLYKKANNIEDEVEGVECELEEKGDSRITRVKILNEKDEKALNKKKGIYVTIDLKKVSNLPNEKADEISNIVSEELKNILSSYLQKEEEVLVVGLRK